MTRLLQEAFEEVSKLEGREQDAVARWLLEELAAERRWQDAFATSPDALAQLAQKALAEHAAGKTLNLDPDKL